MDKIKRPVSTGLIGMMGLLLAAGCGDTGKVAETRENAPAEVIAETEKAAALSEAAEPIETIETETEETESEETESVETEETEAVGADTDYEAIYAPILKETLEIVRDGYDMDREYDYPSTGLMECVMYPGDGDLPDKVKFLIEDFSGDGIPELLIGEDLSYDEELPEQSYIFSIYTIKDGQPALTVDGWARNEQHWMGENRFSNLGSNGAMSTLFGEYHLSADGTEVEWDDFYFSDAKGDGTEIGYYYNTTGVFDENEAEELTISSEEFWDLEESYQGVSIPWTSIGSYEEL